MCYSSVLLQQLLLDVHSVDECKYIQESLRENESLGHRFFIFCFTDFFSQQVSVGRRNKNKNKIHSDHFPIELKSKETQLCFLRF